MKEHLLQSACPIHHFFFDENVIILMCLCFSALFSSHVVVHPDVNQLELLWN